MKFGSNVPRRYGGKVLYGKFTVATSCKTLPTCIPYIMSRMLKHYYNNTNCI